MSTLAGSYVTCSHRTLISIQTNTIIDSQLCRVILKLGILSEVRINFYLVLIYWKSLMTAHGQQFLKSLNKFRL